ncbi:MAG: sugar phosphate isomerase/epimerase [Oscillospiraceae bacterium]|nr:sugar phosphate isomerase/epimerase [Oscillospiraceae bacterium]
MNNTGLVSISFRKLTPEEVISAAANAGLKMIEWGSDVHAPRDQIDRLEEIVQLQKKYGVGCCSYGTYFYLGRDPVEQIPEYINAAKTLGTDTLRLWCGTKSPQEYTQEEKEALFADCRRAAKMAEEQGVTLCMECHIRTFTETKESALELLAAVNSPAFRMYWQPNQFRSIEENVEYAKALKDYIDHIHVFQWKGTDRFPLAEGVNEWKSYLKEIPGEHMLLLEFMPDNKVESLPAEAQALYALKGE